MPEPSRSAQLRAWPRLATALTVLRLSSQYAAFTLLKHIVPLRTLARLAWINGRARDPRRRARAVAGVVRIAHVTGAPRGDCLQLALMLYRELSRAGEHPVLVAGLHQDGGRTIGHAWVEVDGRPIAESIEDVNRFVRTVSFGDDGLPVPP